MRGPGGRSIPLVSFCVSRARACLLETKIGVHICYACMTIALRNQLTLPFDEEKRLF